MAIFTDSVGDVYTQFASASIRWGAPGTGKSVHLHETGERFYKRGCKIIGLNDDEGRFEYLFYHFPGNPEIWNYFCKTQLDWGNVSSVDWRAIKEGKKFFSDLFPWEPKAYPVECFIPAVPGNYNFPAVFKMFTISFAAIRLTEFKLLLGKLTSKQSRTLDLAWSKMKADKIARTFDNFIEIIRGYTTDRKVQDGDVEYTICDMDDGLDLRIKLDKLVGLRIFSTKEDPLNLDIDAIMRDVKTITCFSFFNIEDENIRYVLYGYILRRIRRLRNKALQGTWMYPMLCLLIHEIQDMAPARGQEDTFSAEGQKISCQQLSKIMKKPRDIKLWVHADSQNPASIDRTVRESFTTHFIFRCDRVVLDTIRGLTWFMDEVYIGLQRSKIGVHAIKSPPTGGKDYTGINFPVFTRPPTSFCKSPDDLFKSKWIESGGEFKQWSFDRPKSLIDIGKGREKKKKALSVRAKKILTIYGRLVIKALTEAPGLSIKELSMHPVITESVLNLDLDEDNVKDTVSFLADEGLVDRRSDEKDGRLTRCYLKPLQAEE